MKNINRQDEPALQEGFPTEATGVAKDANKRENREFHESFRIAILIVKKGCLATN
jgi:hypothetical protein